MNDEQNHWTSWSCLRVKSVGGNFLPTDRSFLLDRIKADRFPPSLSWWNWLGSRQRCQRLRNLPPPTRRSTSHSKYAQIHIYENILHFCASTPCCSVSQKVSCKCPKMLKSVHQMLHSVTHVEIWDQSMFQMPITYWGWYWQHNKDKISMTILLVYCAHCIGSY